MADGHVSAFAEGARAHVGRTPPEGRMAPWIDEAFRVAAPKSALEQRDG